MINYTSSSWFPAWKFSKSEIHKDYMIGPCKYNGFRDYLTGEKIYPLTTILWNKTLKVNIILENYNKLRKSKDPEILEKMKKAMLPNDIEI